MFASLKDGRSPQFLYLCGSCSMWLAGEGSTVGAVETSGGAKERDDVTQGEGGIASKSPEGELGLLLPHKSPHSFLPLNSRRGIRENRGSWGNGFGRGSADAFLCRVVQSSHVKQQMSPPMFMRLCSVISH